MVRLILKSEMEIKNGVGYNVKSYKMTVTLKLFGFSIVSNPVNFLACEVYDKNPHKN